MSEHDVVEHFFGCYLLFCLNPKFKGRTYVGFTVDPNRRLKQHNKGCHAGGARRTSNKGPWEMMLIIHGFPNEISALRFEWAWQHPKRSRRLRHLEPKTRKESAYEYHFRVVSQMLCVGPWCRLPLTVRWLTQDRILQFKPPLFPPSHMPITHGSIKSMKLPKDPKPRAEASDSVTDLATVEQKCSICLLVIQTNRKSLECLVPICKSYFHPICLSKHFLNYKSDHFIPVQGNCPECGQLLLWGDIIRHSIGCYRNLSENYNCSPEF